MFLKLIIAAVVASGSAAVVGIGGAKTENKKPQTENNQVSTGSESPTPQNTQSGQQAGQGTSGTTGK